MLLFILLFTIIQSIFAVARGPQCCLPFAFFSALPSWLLFPPSLFQFPGIRLIADFIATMSFTPGFFKFTCDKFPRNFFNDNLLITHDPRKLVTSFPVKLNLKNKNKRNNKIIVSLDESNLSKGQFVALLVPYLLTFAILIVAVCRTLVIYENIFLMTTRNFFSEFKTLASFLFYWLPCWYFPHDLAQKV